MIAHTDALTRAFAALADPTRRAILADLAAGELTVNDLVGRHALSQPAISKHLKVLEGAGLIARGRSAQRRPCRLDPDGMRPVVDWLSHFRDSWVQSFDRMDALLVELKKAPKP